MNLCNKSVRLILIFIVCILFSSCTGKSAKTVNPLEPESNFPNESTESAEKFLNNRNVLTVYDAVIDADSKNFEINVIERSAGYHFPLTQGYPNALQIIDYGWTPNFWADIKLTHPFPGTGIDGFDPRVIAILPANPGVRFEYPIFNAYGNNKVLLDPDGYTKLFDDLGGSIPGNTNPFKAYFKDQFFRVWSSTGALSETQRWDMDINGFAGPLVFKLVVDVSTSFPGTPHPIITNAPEPVSINTFVGDGLTKFGGTAEVEVTFLDWQGPNEIKCKVEAPELFSGAIQLFYSHPGLNSREYVFKGLINNSKLAGDGEYNILIAAWDIPTDIHIFDESIATVDEDINFNPVDITPALLNVPNYPVLINGNYGYVSDRFEGLYIFNVSNPVSPILIARKNEMKGVYLRSFLNNRGYASKNNSLLIYDFKNPVAPVLMKEIVANHYIGGFVLKDGYAYCVSTGSQGNFFQIVDVEPIDSAHVVTSNALPWIPWFYNVSNGYAYIGSSEGLYIMDVDPPESPNIIERVDILVYSFVIKDNYAYMSKGFDGLLIARIDPPGTLNIISSIDTPGDVRGISILNSYAYIADGYSGLQIIEIESPESPHIVKSVPLPFYASGITVYKGYAIISSKDSQQIVDIEPINSAHFVKAMELPGQIYDVAIAGGYSVVGCENEIKIIDTDPLYSAKVIKTIELSSYVADIKATIDYAFVANYSNGLQIIDINPPETSHIVKTVKTNDVARSVFVSNGYAYIADWQGGLNIIDIDPPDSASVVKTLNINYANDVCVVDSYAYVPGGNSSLYIVDIEPIDSAYIAKIVDLQGATTVRKIDIFNGFALIAGSHYFQIVDIDPINAAHIAKTIELQAPDVWDVKVSSGYAFIAAGSNGLLIIDIDPIDMARVVKTIDTPDEAHGIQVTENKAFIADCNSGLRILKLW